MVILKNLFKLSAIYLFFFLAVFLLLGTFTAELVIRSIIIQIRATGFLSSHETSVIIVVTAILFIATLFFAKWLTIWFWKSLEYTGKVNMMIVLLLFYGLIAIYWLFPRDTILHEKYVSKNGLYVGGSYPDSDKIASLRVQGYSGIISLLDPIVLPQEPILIQQESDSTTEYNMPLIKIPMLPGGIKNIEAENQIKKFIEASSNKKYYVHAYYGSDRVKQFIDIVDEFDNDKVVKKAAKVQEPVKQVVTLSRGEIMYIDDHLVITPKPTDEEFTTIINHTPNKIITLPIKHVISINPDDKLNDNKALTSMLKNNSIEFLWLPISRYPYNPAKVLDVANKIKSLDGGVLVYSYFMPPESITLSGLIESYKSNLPTLPKNLFEHETMSGGKVEVLAPNIISGPVPTEIDIKYYLKNRGIKGIFYFGNCDDPSAVSIKTLSKSYSLLFSCKKENESFNDVLASENGPWYIYGPNVNEYSHLSVTNSQVKQISNTHRNNSL